MKSLTSIFLVLMVICTVTACTKDDGNIENPDEQGLTSCPANTNCQYLYVESADLALNSDLPINGPYRLFWNEANTNFSSASIFIKAPMKGSTFTLDNKDLKDGKFKIINNCPTCYSAPLIILEAYCKGKKINSTNGVDKEKWLLEVKLILSLGIADSKDTINIKQYYYPKS